ncbi:hypothetical protein D9M71_521470 [compost metagenome]
MLQAGVRRRRDAGEQQHHARQEHQQREHRRRQAGGGAQGLATGREQAPGLAGQQQKAGQDQRQADIDQAVEQQGRGQGRSAELAGEGGQQYRLEYADAAGHMAEHPGSEGQQIDQQEGAQGRRFRQQHIEHAGGGADIDQGDQQLQRRQAQTGQAHAAIAQRDIDAAGHRRLLRALARDPDDQQGAGQ